LRDPKNLEIAQAILHDTFPPSDYYDGAVNDLDQVDNLRNPPEWPLGDLKVPTLILHGTKDILVKFEAAKYHAEHIPGAKLIAYEGGSHFAASTHEQEMRKEVAEFMASVLRPAVP
jgi:pimeloyl-ACP methyl ester carboxylesterase